jgi:hypothetical protein
MCFIIKLKKSESKQAHVIHFGVLHPVAHALSRLSGKPSYATTTTTTTTVVAKDGFPDNLDTSTC